LSNTALIAERALGPSADLQQSLDQRESFRVLQIRCP
jgi:hypothetical protein